MNQIVVTKEVVYSYNTSAAAITNIKQINDLETGSLAIFTEAGVLVTAANMATVLDDVKKCYFAVGNQQSAASAKSMITVPFPRVGGNVNYTKQAYAAPVKLKKFVGDDGTTSGTGLNMPTYANGNIVAIKIVNTTSGLRTIGAVDEQEVFRYEYTGIAGDTNNTMITKLIAKINADGNRIVNATVVGSQAGIALETVDYGVTFSIGLDEALQGATVEQPEGGTVGVSVAINYGIGTSAQVAALEDMYSAERGNTTKYAPLAIKYYSNPSLVVDAETYNIYTIQWDGDRSMPLGNQATNRFTIVVAIPNGTALATSFETIIAEVFGGVFTTSDIETGL